MALKCAVSSATLLPFVRHCAWSREERECFILSSRFVTNRCDAYRRAWPHGHPTSYRPSLMARRLTQSTLPTQAMYDNTCTAEVMAIARQVGPSASAASRSVNMGRMRYSHLRECKAIRRALGKRPRHRSRRCAYGRIGNFLHVAETKGHIRRASEGPILLRPGCLGHTRPQGKPKASAGARGNPSTGRARKSAFP